MTVKSVTESLGGKLCSQSNVSLIPGTFLCHEYGLQSLVKKIFVAVWHVFE
jgi:hypothetical protein